jgi:hypothetical protein
VHQQVCQHARQKARQNVCQKVRQNVRPNAAKMSPKCCQKVFVSDLKGNAPKLICWPTLWGGAFARHFGGHFGIHFGGHFGGILATFWRHFGDILAAFWRTFWRRFGDICRTCGVKVIWTGVMPCGACESTTSIPDINHNLMSLITRTVKPVLCREMQRGPFEETEVPGSYLGLPKAEAEAVFEEADFAVLEELHGGDFWVL